MALSGVASAFDYDSLFPALVQYRPFLPDSWRMRQQLNAEHAQQMFYPANYHHTQKHSV